MRERLLSERLRGVLQELETIMKDLDIMETQKQDAANDGCFFKDFLLDD